MVGTPCIQFLIDASTCRPLATSIKYTLVPRVDPAEQFHAVSCDSRGWVVVRKLHERTNAIAIATACWQSDRLAQHAQQVPVQWAEIEAGVRDALAGASTMADADRTSVDDTALGGVTGTRYAASEKKTISKHIGAVIGFVVLAAVAVPAIFLYERIRGKFDRGDVGNGDPCSRDTQCASGRCGGSICRSTGKGSAGNWCEDDVDCANGVCHRRQCYIKDSLRRGDSCTISEECASGSCLSGAGGTSICR